MTADKNISVPSVASMAHPVATEDSVVVANSVVPDY